jgi:hypothetical protein
MTGDDCVPAGFESFSGTLPVGSAIAAINWTVGLPRSPASGRRAGFLKIVDRDTFQAGDQSMPDLTFTRLRE